MNTNMLYKILAGALVFGAIMSFCCFSPAETSAQKSAPDLPNPAQSNAPPKGLLADRDNDGLSDGLQKKLTEVPSNQLFDVIVTFKGPGNAQSAQQAVGPFNVKRKFNIISGFSATMTAAQAKALARVPGVFRVEENFMVYATLDSANRDFGTETVRTDFALTGSGIGICVLDTGVDPNHEQLDGGKIAGFEDFIGTATHAYDDHGHGTHVSSIAAGDGLGDSNVAATYKGVAPAAKIYAGKVLDSSGSGTADGIVEGLDWCAAEPGVDIISMSLGTTGSSDGRDALSQAVNSAVSNHGKIAVVAAGNSGSGTYTVGSPGAASEAITVGAAAEWSAPEGSPNHSDGVYLASFSSRGPTTDERNKPDVAAPGVSITAAKIGTTAGYVTYSGTSMATPFVSGTVALALQADSTLTPAQVKDTIVSTAKDCGPAGLDNDWGAGLLDGYAFVAKVMGGTGSNPFPRLQHLAGSVSDIGEWQYSFDVSDPSVPVAVTITIEGEPICPLGNDSICVLFGGWEWTPDLDAELWGPGGLLAASTCMIGSECASCGRQETLHIGAPEAGTHTIYVFPYNGKGGNFTVDISTGPVGSGCSETDSDCDGTPNDADGCPIDPNKIAPDICGCGVADTDSDHDDTPDCIDPCPNDADDGCQSTSDCDSCFKEACDGVCHPKEVGTLCPDCSSTPPEASCPDGTCGPGEDSCSCPGDCGPPAADSETSCTDGIDNDCDRLTDCDDLDCTNESVCKCSPKGALCNSNDQCCSGTCAGIKCK